ncbi:MAG: single-stranded-DNA-specific exonuclease RecJ [Alphaproteobacteria bacterium]|nr:single-stranded-DNA-specific exonuclease RecJ [Alphaproteobacteria bacterium]
MSGEGLLDAGSSKVFKSVRNYKWSQVDYDQYLVESLRRETSLPSTVSQILSKYVSSPKDAKDYLDPKLKNLLPDPFTLQGMKEAVEVTLRALENNKKIVIFGDYDVDGATSSSLIKNALDPIGADVQIYIPDRIKEGYGPNIEAIQKLKNQGMDLIITVDCGSTSYKEIDFAKGLGMDVVILDHHKCSEDLPNADAIVNPNRVDDESGYGYLAAVGVSFLFMMALCHRLKASVDAAKNINLLYLLDLVALGTVCDVVPLVGLNRALVKQGIKVIKSRNNIGMKALIDVANISGEDISVYHLGFVLGPRINAGGRVGESSMGAELLTSKEYEEAISISTSLDMYNQERKEIELSVLEDAKRQAATIDKDSPVIIVHGEGWHPGVIGIVAGRLKESYRKPVAVIAFEDGIGKASCRSIEGIDFGAAVIEAKESTILENGGGHAMAAGFTILKENLDSFQKFLSDKFYESYIRIRNNMVSKYADILSVSSVNLPLIEYINKIGPFGSGNAQPRFMIKNVIIMYPKVLKDSHISCLVLASKDSLNKGGVRAIAFGVMQNTIGEVLLSQKSGINLIVTLDINKWNDNKNPQFIIQDVIMNDKN